MCPFKYQKIHQLFAYIHDYHMTNGTDPTSDYKALRSIIEDRSIVSGKNRMRAMIHHMTALKNKYPQHESFLNWFYKLYRDHHPKPETNDATAPPVDVVDASLPMSVPEPVEITTPLLQEDAHSVNIEDVQKSIERTVCTVENKPRHPRRWWLLFLA